MRVDAGKDPVMYKLKDIMDAEIPGNYYRTQLTKASPPQNEEFFRVEKIVKSKWEDGKELILVKYLHYPPKFNRWILKSDLMK